MLNDMAPVQDEFPYIFNPDLSPVFIIRNGVIVGKDTVDRVQGAIPFLGAKQPASQADSAYQTGQLTQQQLLARERGEGVVQDTSVPATQVSPTNAQAELLERLKAGKK
jgi:hypothetical protein